jgi:hypothetical protein
MSFAKSGTYRLRMLGSGDGCDFLLFIVLWLSKANRVDLRATMELVPAALA